MKPIYLLTIICILISGCKHQKIQYADINKEDYYKVILLAGQSNMVGKAPLTELNINKFNNVVYFNHGFNTDLKQDNDVFGPEVGLSQILRDSFPRDNFIIIKYAINASSIWNWTPLYNNEKASLTGHPEFGNLYQKFIDQITIDLNSINTEFAAFLWMQGESDARIEGAGIEYFNNFKLFVNTLREDLSTPNLPVILGMINPPISNYPMVKVIRQSQLLIDSCITNTHTINTDDLNKLDDKIHYSSKGQIDLGHRFGNQLSEIFKQ